MLIIKVQIYGIRRQLTFIRHPNLNHSSILQKDGKLFLRAERIFTCEQEIMIRCQSMVFLIIVRKSSSHLVNGNQMFLCKLNFIYVINIYKIFITAFDHIIRVRVFCLRCCFFIIRSLCLDRILLLYLIIISSFFLCLCIVRGLFGLFRVFGMAIFDSQFLNKVRQQNLALTLNAVIHTVEMEINRECEYREAVCYEFNIIRPAFQIHAGLVSAKGGDYDIAGTDVGSFSCGLDRFAHFIDQRQVNDFYALGCSRIQFVCDLISLKGHVDLHGIAGRLELVGLAGGIAKFISLRSHQGKVIQKEIIRRMLFRGGCVQGLFISGHIIAVACSNGSDDQLGIIRNGLSICQCHHCGDVTVFIGILFALTVLLKYQNDVRALGDLCGNAFCVVVPGALDFALKIGRFVIDQGLDLMIQGIDRLISKAGDILIGISFDLYRCTVI